MLRIVLLERIVDANRTVEVFLIPPAGDAERRHLHVVNRGDQRLPLPELVVIRMKDEIVPGRNLFVKILRVRVGKRTERQVPVERVVAIEGELLDLL